MGGVVCGAIWGVVQVGAGCRLGGCSPICLPGLAHPFHRFLADGVSTVAAGWRPWCTELRAGRSVRMILYARASMHEPVCSSLYAWILYA